ncbi:SMEK domain-containing protein [Enterobacter asburiae]|uniref:SMEK domain-containing protein n=1 Tax=Enterobacter asburiae TaxID=61645 RepID=UPI0018C1E8E2|nr:SMEK domain-containing protein [Enterobacter asburiae]MBF9770130.1 SMEK domain-containing protein [Enterobacter asburiae]MBS6013531.1 SMEK domain-containing protein [Enterobacter cloacae]
MLNRQVQNNNITFAFSLLSTVITFNSKQGMFDINKTLETVLTTILNKTYKLSLINLNIEKHNHPAIDLGDSNEGIAIQVTSDGSKDKFVKTMDMLVKHKLHETYTKVWMMIISNDPVQHHTKQGFVTHVKNLSDLAKSICEKSGAEFDDLYKICEQEFGVYFPGRNISLLKPTQITGANPNQQVDNFIRINNIDLSYEDYTITTDDIRDDLIKLKNTISQLNEEQRWFLFRVLSHTIEYDDGKYIETCKIPTSIITNGMNSNQRNAIYETINSLERINLAYHDEEDYKLECSVFCIYFIRGKYKEFDYFSGLALFIRETSQLDKLEEIIVNCDFSLID